MWFAIHFIKKKKLYWDYEYKGGIYIFRRDIRSKLYFKIGVGMQLTEECIFALACFYVNRFFEFLFVLLQSIGRYMS